VFDARHDITVFVLLQSWTASHDQPFGVNRLNEIITGFHRRDTWDSNIKPTQICFFACSSSTPWDLKKLKSCFATPTPALPAPKKRMRCSESGNPEAAEAMRAELINPDRTTAPVPCI
jgi:hypothetical protein